MARPFTRAQALENAAFLRALRRCGNVRLAAREVGLAYGTVQHRRGAHPTFAQRWDAALVFARARLAGQVGDGEGGGDGRAPRAGREHDPHRTRGGEAVVVRLADGRVQMRQAQPGKLTRACEQAFLAALSATCNVALSAKAAGSNPGAFYWRRRQRPGFAREWTLALKQGYARIEAALLESGLAEAFEDDAWRRNDPPAIPPMTVNQALQLMYLHQKEARLWATPEAVRCRPGESNRAMHERRSAEAEARRKAEYEAYRVHEAAWLASGKPPLGAHEPAAPVLPDLAQVTGWSKADPAKRAHHEGVALFGGWRMADLKEREEE